MDSAIMKTPIHNGFIIKSGHGKRDKKAVMGKEISQTQNEKGREHHQRMPANILQCTLDHHPYHVDVLARNTMYKGLVSRVSHTLGYHAFLLSLAVLTCNTDPFTILQSCTVALSWQKCNRPESHSR